MHLGVFNRQLRRDLLEVPGPGSVDAAAILVVRVVDMSTESQRMRLPAERRVGGAHADRRRQLPLHRLRVALDERHQERQAPRAAELEMTVGGLPQDVARFGQAIEREQRCREVRVGGDELGIEPDRLAQRRTRMIELAEANQRVAQTVERERFARVGWRSRRAPVPAPCPTPAARPGSSATR